MSGVTIFSDASFCQQTKAAGWGAWTITAGRSAVYGGEVPDLVFDANEAELWAAVEALRCAAEAGDLAGAEFVVLTSDSAFTLEILASYRSEVVRIAKPKPGGHPLRLSSPKVSKRVLRAFAAFDQLVLPQVWVRHVRGHTDGDGRQWVNDRCDKEARKHMRARRKVILAAEAIA